MYPQKGYKLKFIQKLVSFWCLPYVLIPSSLRFFVIHIFWCFKWLSQATILFPHLRSSWPHLHWVRLSSSLNYSFLDLQTQPLQKQKLHQQMIVMEVAQMVHHVVTHPRKMIQSRLSWIQYGLGVNMALSLSIPFLVSFLFSQIKGQYSIKVRI